MGWGCHQLDRKRLVEKDRGCHTTRRDVRDMTDRLRKYIFGGKMFRYMHCSTMRGLSNVCGQYHAKSVIQIEVKLGQAEKLLQLKGKL